MGASSHAHEDGLRPVPGGTMAGRVPDVPWEDTEASCPVQSTLTSGNAQPVAACGVAPSQGESLTHLSLLVGVPGFVLCLWRGPEAAVLPPALDRRVFMAGPAGAPTPWLRGPKDEGGGAQDEARQGGRREESSRKEAGNGRSAFLLTGKH